MAFSYLVLMNIEKGEKIHEGEIGLGPIIY
jgi:hypothetical protein